VLLQASLQKSLDSQKKFIYLKKLSRLKMFALKFAVFLKMMMMNFIRRHEVSAFFTMQVDKNEWNRTFHNGI